MILTDSCYKLCIVMKQASKYLGGHMTRVVVVTFLVLILFISVGTADITPIEWRNLSRHYPITTCKSQCLQLPTSLRPDMGLWMTLEIIFNDGVMTDTFPFAQAYFDSSDYGLDANTCWIDTQPMIKYYDSISGYSYMLTVYDNFFYTHNHCYQFRAKGYGSIPPFIDTLRSPINPIQLTSPQPNNIVIRGTNLTVQWVPHYEHNILIQILDNAENALLYYPLDDNGSFTIPANDIDSLETGLLYFMIGRANQKIDIIPGFPLVAVTASIIQIPLYLQDAPGIEEETNRITNLPTLEIYPNPAQSFLNILLPQTVNSIPLKIYDVSGNLIKQTEISQPVNTISLNGINPGVYFVQAGSATIIRKLIITK